MLQFLQYKVFGSHQLPEGWAVVCAGNPPECNRSVREFDPATLDRMKRVDVEPDLAVWQEYATSHGVHPAVTTFLDAKPGSFYQCSRGAKGMRLVTPRGWEDLSKTLRAYEALGIAPDRELIRQYLQDDEVARNFWAYYELFHKYEDSYRIADILAGHAAPDIEKRARAARFDERVAVVGLLQDRCLAQARESTALKEALTLARKDMVALKPKLQAGGGAAAVSARIDELLAEPDVAKRPKGICTDRKVLHAERVNILRACAQACAKADAAGQTDSFPSAREAFNALCKKQKALLKDATAHVDNAFGFLDKVFGAESQESLILTTKLATDLALVKTVAMHGCKSYMAHNKDLLLTERGLELKGEIDALMAEVDL